MQYKLTHRRKSETEKEKFRRWSDRESSKKLTIQNDFIKDDFDTILLNKSQSAVVKLNMLKNEVVLRADFSRMRRKAGTSVSPRERDPSPNSESSKSASDEV